MKNDILKKNGQFRNVRVEYGFGAVCCTIRYVIYLKCLFLKMYLSIFEKFTRLMHLPSFASCFLTLSFNPIIYELKLMK